MSNSEDSLGDRARALQAALDATGIIVSVREARTVIRQAEEKAKGTALRDLWRSLFGSKASGADGPT